MIDPTRCVWLSHELGGDTPVYGGTDRVQVGPVRQISAGDTANTSHLDFGNHVGTHVDAPLHFLADGASLSRFGASEWVFHRPVLLDVPTPEATLIEAAALEAAWVPEAAEADIVLLRTGAEAWRGERAFWERGPGLAPEAATWLCEHAPKLSVLGLDTISLTSFQHREAGRAAHRILLGKGLRIIEDLHLADLPAHGGLDLVIALPLRIEEGDGAPTTVLGVMHG